MQPGLHQLLAAVVVGLAVLAGCATPPSGRRPSGGTPSTPAASEDPATPATDAEAVWMDCRADADCTTRREGTVCHQDVMGGTCAPPCAEDSLCTGMDADLHCVAQRCVKP